MSGNVWDEKVQFQSQAQVRGTDKKQTVRSTCGMQRNFELVQTRRREMALVKPVPII
jgi:hypothetical protein